MTLDEAIKHCEEVADGMTEQGKCEECAAEHRQLANWLKELKQLKEQEFREDAISRQAALDCLTATGLKKFDFILDARNKIKNLPSVKPQYTEAEIQKMQEMQQAEIEKAYELGKAEQPKTGHWIKEKSICSWDGYSYQCSVCGRSIHLDIEVEDLEDYPYCHCGAKMESEEEEFDNNLEEMLEKLWNEVEE